MSGSGRGSVIRRLLTRRTKPGRMFNLLLSYESVWPETVPDHYGGKLTQDRTRRVMTIHVLRRPPYNLPIATVSREGRDDKGYALDPQVRATWRAIRMKEQGL